MLLFIMRFLPRDQGGAERDWASFEKQLSKFCCEDLATLKTSLNPIDFDCMEQKKDIFI